MINYYPLIVPELFFYNHKNEPDSYYPLNPSIYIDNNEITILVRNVNYLKYTNKQFKLSQVKSNSIYLIGKGDINNINDITYDKVIIDYNGFNKYDTYWTGIEDIRFISKNKILLTSPELNEARVASLFIGYLDNKTIKIVEKLPIFDKINMCEKNWMPFSDNIYKFIYSINPLCIIDNKNKIYIKDLPELDKYHGSTNGIKFIYNEEEYYLFLIHKDIDNKIYHRFMLYNNDNVIYSKEFYFFKCSYIEFPCSIAVYNNNYYISLGVNDRQAFIVSISYDEIINFLMK